jgi:threonine dehydratase
MPITIDDIRTARALLRGIIIDTPLLPDERLSQELNASVWIKAECTQRSGSFKIRGAYTMIRRLPPEARKRGVIAPSAGNHAQGVALAARLTGLPATIVMPERAPLTKIMATQRLGAEVILHGATFDDAPIGGGGLISGIALAVKALLPRARIVGVQAAGCAPVPRSLAAGHPVAVAHAHTIADGIAVKRPGELTLSIIRQLVDDVVTVDDDAIARAIAHAVQYDHLVVEGAGAAGLAALLSGQVTPRPGETVCVPLCGGNIDSNLLTRVLEQVAMRTGARSARRAARATGRATSPRLRLSCGA